LKKNNKVAVVAIGGNALLDIEGKSSYSSQMIRTLKFCKELVKVIKSGYKVVLTHGNGPQVGNLLIQQKTASKYPYMVPSMPLDICVAMTQGQIGYMIEQNLRNVLNENSIDNSIAVVLTQVVVNKNDPAFGEPTKFIGPFFENEKDQFLINQMDWKIKKDSNRGYRRVVPSPKPIDIVEKYEIAELIERGYIVIACGGGGIPVIRGRNGELRGVEAVIDKDLAAEKLATLIGADILVLISSVPQVSLNFDTLMQKNIGRMTKQEAKRYLEEGHFPPGSMGPKVEAAIKFLEDGGKSAIITSAQLAHRALSKRDSGTEIVPYS